MGTFVKGDVVILPFPFSDLSTSKRRPALVVASFTGDDMLVCMITSQSSSADRYAVPITDSDFAQGKLQQDSNVRPNRLFTADSNIVAYKAGSLKQDKIDAVIAQIIKILQA